MRHQSTVVDTLLHSRPFDLKSKLAGIRPVTARHGTARRAHSLDFNAVLLRAAPGVVPRVLLGLGVRGTDPEARYRTIDGLPPANLQRTATE